MEELNERVIKLKEKIEENKKVEEELKKLQIEIKREKEKLERFEKVLNKEKGDVEKLQKVGFNNLVYTILNKKEEKSSKEQEEYMAAKFKYEQCFQYVQQLKEKIYSSEHEIYELRNLELEYNNIIEEKERIILEKGDSDSKEIINIREQITDMEAYVKKIREVVSAAWSVLYSMDTVINSLKDAKSWGTVDIIGSGAISTMVKHSHINKAEKDLYKVKDSMRELERQIRYMQDFPMNIEYVDINIGKFATFVDYFFDGLFADLYVQSKIEDFLKKLLDNYDKVEMLIRNLKRREEKVTNTIEELYRKKSHMVFDIR